MKGTIILGTFFLTFTLASLLVPYPMFPGNFICALMGDSVSQVERYLGAVLNGVFYGAILWLVFIGISRRLEQEK